jgi:hypothetical protein
MLVLPEGVPMLIDLRATMRALVPMPIAIVFADGRESRRTHKEMTARPMPIWASFYLAPIFEACSVAHDKKTASCTGNRQ